MDTSLVIGIVASLIGVWAVLVVILWLLRPQGVPVRELVRVVPDVVRLVQRLIADRSTPLDVRIVLVVLVVWILNPIDLIPEFIPVVGPLDDAIVAILALRYARRRLGVTRLESHWRGTADGFALVRRIIGG